ncbi:hypothetical protein ACM758_01950 [Pseudomonas aeruginosa]
MRCASVLLALLLTACGQSSHEQRAENLADTLAAEAFRRRFFAGHTGPDEYASLAELPPIPASFDEPAADGETAATAAQEDTP